MFAKVDTVNIVEAQLYVDGAPLPSLNPGFLDGYHRERGGYYHLGPMTFTATVTSQHINLQVSHTYHFQLRSPSSTTRSSIWRDINPAADWMWPQLEIKAIGDAAIQNATVVTGQSSVYFSGWVDGDSSSQCGIVTLADGSSSSFHAFHNYSYHSNYNALQYNNIGGCMNNSNGEFTVPHTGLYQINMHVVNSTTDKRALVYLHMSNPLKNYKGNADPDMSLLEVNNTGSTNPHNRSGTSHTMHFQAGERFYFYQYDGTNGAVNDMWLTITALQDQVPQTITARPGMTLETLEGICDGRSITVASGTYTLPTAAFQTWSNTDHAMKDVDASIINYKPPPGTKQVIYEFRFIIWYNESTSGFQNGAYDFYIDGNKLGHTLVFQKGVWESNFDTVKLIVDIGENDYANNKILDWNSPKEIKIQMAEASNGSKGFVMHKGRYNNDDYFSAHLPATELLDHPTIKITAIGDGPGIRPASGGNIVNTSFSTQLSLTAPNTVPGIEIEPARLVIKPTSTDSIIELRYSIILDGNFNSGFRITRNINGTDVLVVPASNKWEGFLSVLHGEETHNSVPESITTLWYDEPNTINEVTYKLWVGGSSGDVPITINRPTGNTGLQLYESGVSTAAAIEHNKHARPYDEDGALTIPTFTGSSTAGKLYNDGGTLKFDGRPLGHKVLGAKGQLLETLAGVCDGRAITVSSGTYTLENVTASLSATTTFVDLTGSKINYKPPVGVKTVIYEFEFQHNYGSTTNGWGYYKFLLDGTQVGGVFELGFDDYGSGIFKVSFPFEIGENDLANGKILTWDTNKEIKIQFREHSSISQVEVHVAKNWKSLTSETGLVKPRIKITAIGDGPSYSPATGSNVATRYFSTMQAINVPYALPGYHVSELDLTITPSATDSVIELKFNLFAELNENVCFRIKRNNDFVVPATATNKGALSVAVYDNQEANTPFVHTVRWYDEPNTTSTITYKLYINVGQDSQNNEGGWINRAAAIGNDYEEEGVSTSIAIEHAKRGNPFDSENALSIPEFAGSDPDNKLYNNGGVLHFNGNPVGSGGVMMQFEDTNLLSHQGSYTLKHNETNFCVANENAQLSTFRLTQIGSSGTGKYNVSVVVKIITLVN